MKPVKMLSLGVLAVLLAMALGGAPSAMAEGTELCKTDQIPCKSENVITNVHEVTPEGKKATLLSSLGTVECDVLFSGESLGEATEGPALIQGKFTFTSCLLKGTACEVKEVGASTLFSVLKEGHETATATGKSEVNVKCGFINCTYVGEGIKGTRKGPLLSTLKNGEMTISAQAVKVTGALCPTEGKIDLTMTPLVETFISQGNMYCVRYENPRGRWLLGPNLTTCTGNHGVRGFNYELIWSRNVLTSGTMVCVSDNDGLPGVLFYLTRAGGVCGNKDATEVGDYELGMVA
jgi:hypothetical protein